MERRLGERPPTKHLFPSLDAIVTVAERARSSLLRRSINYSIN
jgi:hypothetical protein